MNLKNINKIFLFFLIGITSKVNAQISVGSPAPSIHITNWITTSPIPEFKDKFLVLDFWATWCAPCLATVPHMNELQENFRSNKSLIFISLSDEQPYKIKKLLQNFRFKSFVATDTTSSTQE